jgi:hypothetical protein
MHRSNSRFTLLGLFLSRANARSRPKGDLEKIKTIGDACMVAAGLPEPRFGRRASGHRNGDGHATVHRKYYYINIQSCGCASAFTPGRIQVTEPLARAVAGEW